MTDGDGSRKQSQADGGIAQVGANGALARPRPLGFSALVPLTVAGLCIAIGASAWTQVVADFFGRREPTWIAEDFVAFYSAGRMLATGLGPDLLRVEVIGAIEQNVAGHPVGGSGILPYFHPPFVAFAFAPLTRLSLARAYQVWTLINLVVLAGDCWLLWLIADAIPRRWRVVILVAYVTLAPVAYGLRLGQISLVLQASVSAGYLWLVRGHDRLAGGALALLLVKPEWLLVITIFLAWKRRWAVLSVIVPASVIAITVSIAAVGLRTALTYPDYLLDTTSRDTYGVSASIMFNWLGIVSLVVRSWSSAFRTQLAAALSALTVFGAALLWRGPVLPRGARFPFQWMALVLATGLVDPHLYLQDTVMIVPALVAVAAALALRSAGSAVPEGTPWKSR